MKVTIEREIIEWTYEWSMKYKRFEWMTLQEFYDINVDNLKKYIGKPHEKCWRTIAIIYSDIIEND